MSSDADLLADRRSLRRKLTLWRLLAASASSPSPSSPASPGPGATPGTSRQAHIARVTISGFISGDRRTLELIKSLEDSKASAVLLSIEQPRRHHHRLGGAATTRCACWPRRSRSSPSSTGSRPRAAISPRWAPTTSSPARPRSSARSACSSRSPMSGGCSTRSASRSRTIKSSPLKAAPNGFEPTSPEARAALQRVVEDNYDWFKRLVQRPPQARPTPSSPPSPTGACIPAVRPLALKLVDAIGGEPEAIAWLEREKGVAKDLPIRDWRRRSESSSFGIWSASEALARAAGLRERGGADRPRRRPAAWFAA